ncbi:MAG: hypothetical protein ACM3UU_04225 [Ignavibacteriales bacterium]
MENENRQTDYIGNIKKNFLIRLTFLTLVILFIAFKGITSKNVQVDSFFFTLLFSVINGMSIIAISIGFIYKKKRNDTYKSGELKNRLEKFVLASRYLYSTIESCVIFTAIGFVVTNYYAFIFETIILYLWLIYIFPTKKNIQREIELDIDNT